MFATLALLSASAALERGRTLWPSVEMYPAIALDKRQQGQVTLRLTREESEASSCVILSKSPSSELNAATCALIAPRFRALLVGLPASKIVKVHWRVPGVASSTKFDGAIPFDPQTWVTPDDIPMADYPASGSGRTEVKFDVDTDGSVAACVITASSGSPALDQRLCTLLGQRAAFLPAVDALGSARIAHANGAITWFTR